MLCKFSMTYLSFEKVFSSADADLVDVDFALLGQQAEARVLLQLAGLELSKDQQKFAKRNVSVIVLVDLLKKI